MANFKCMSSFEYRDYYYLTNYLTKRLSRLGIPYRAIYDRATHGFNLYVPEDVVELCRDLFCDEGLTDDEFYKRLADQTLENGCIQVISL